MAQVGRISGPLLEANLLRQGIANGTQQNLSFKNTNGDTTLLKVDIANGRIGVDIEAPANELQISQTTQTIDLIGDTANIANFSVSTNNINVDSGDIFLNASELIAASNLETEQFFITDNYISTNNTNTDIDLKFNGTGELEINTNLEVFGNLHAGGNVTFDGNITFGDADTDSINLNADVGTDIIPTVTDTYGVGSVNKRWEQITTNLVNGQLLASGQVNVNGIFLESRQGNIFYVAKLGDDTNAGDHPNSPLLTIQEAIARCDASTAGPVTIRVYPGVYEEACPMELPDNVSIVGVDIRNVIIKPTVATQDKDIFLLNDGCLVTELTIKDYFYNSTDDTGYAFRFASGGVISTRSPYVQNVTVITQGSVTSADDPRGFDEGDAGKGALIDADDLDVLSPQKSMLFHSATFITPGVDAITMTNGVRVEWLNSFTYFANRGLYATNGSGSGNGAEVRSIGSANVYGNYGAVADGDNTLMYLIQHNMAYVGAGRFVDNDASRATYANEIQELNSGVIHHVTTDHLGGFRIGDNFWVDFETGNTTIDIDTLTVNQFNALRVNTGGDTTVIDGAYIDTGNLTIVDNIIQSNTGDLNLASATGTINLQDNTNITGNLNITGNFTYDGTLNIKGDEATDTLTFNTFLDQDFNPHQHQTFKLGSFEKKWLVAHLNRLETPDIKIYDNIIESITSNADLEIRAAGTGFVRVTDSATFSNNLTINGTTDIFDNLSINSNLPIIGDVNQTGNFSVTQDVTVDQNIDVGAAAKFEEVLISNNVITTTTSNADLELRASGTGTLNLQETVNVANSLASRDTTATNANITLNASTDNANIGNVEINDNYIETTTVDGDLNFVADRNVVVTGTDVTIVQDLTVQGATDLQATTVIGLITHVGDTIQTGNVTLNGEWTNGNTYIEDNFITTTQLNADLDLRASGTGNIVVTNNNVTFGQDLTVQGATDLQALDITGILDHTGAYNQTGNYDIAGELTVDNVYVEDNFITTTSGNLTLEAAGTGTIFASSNNVSITNNLDVDGVTNLDDTDIDGDIVHIGNRIQTGNYTLNGELTVDNVYVEDNFITTTSGNLTLGATGDINVDANDVEIAQDLTVSSTTSLQGTSITGTVTHVGNRTQTGNYEIAGEITNGNILIEDNFISTTNTNSDLELRASGTGEVVIDPTDSLTIENNLFVGGTLDYQGSLTINGNVALLGNTQDGSLTVTNNFDVTGTLDISSQAQFEDIRIEDNFISTTLSNSDLELRASGAGEVLIPNNNVQVNNNLFAASISTGDINVNNDLVLDELVITDSNIEINENYVSTKTSNSNLELRATGNVVVQENTIVEQDLTVNGDTNLQGTTINGTLTQVGNRTQTGTYVLTGNLTIGTLVTDEDISFGNIEVAGNIFQTTLSNSDLEFRALDGNIRFDSDTQINNNLTTGSINVDAITVSNDVALEIVELSTDIQFEDNYITTTNSNSNLELRANNTGSVYLDNIEINNNSISTTSTIDSTVQSIIFEPDKNLNITSTSALQLPIGNTLERNNIAGDIRFNRNNNIFEGTGSTGSTVSLDGVYSTDRLTSIIADPTSNNIRFIVNGVTSPLDSTNLVGEITGEGLNIHRIQVDDIILDSNTIITNVSNSDLDLAANGTGELVLDDLSLKDNLIKDNGNNLILKNTRFGHVKLAGTYGVVVPYGTTINPVVDPQLGDTRWNTADEQLETWDGTQYIVATGTGGAISQSEFDELLLEYTIIFG